MSYYGILRSAISTGADSELLCRFAAPMSLMSNSPVFTGDSMSLKRFTSRSTAQRWEIETAVVPDSNPSDIFVQSVVAASSEIVYVRMPQLVGRTKLSLGTSLATSAAASKGASSVQITGYGSQKVPVGEFVTFTGDSKVYVVTDHTSNLLSIFPPLKQDLPTNTAIAHSDTVVMRAVYDLGNKSGVVFSDGVLANPGTVRLVEKL